jgi:hypothetical protein
MAERAAVTPAAAAGAAAPVGPDAPLLDVAANPLGVLALFEQATTGLGPKLIAGGLSCMIISAVLNPVSHSCPARAHTVATPVSQLTWCVV